MNGTWEYSGDPTSSAKDEVRFLLGDTDDADPQFSDEEINYLVATEGNASSAAISGARTLAAQYARLVSKTVGDLRLESQQRSANYAALAKFLASGSGGGGVAPIPAVTGTRWADKELAYADPDRVPSQFRIGQDDIDQEADQRWGSHVV
jgi:hypothetical protein